MIFRYFDPMSDCVASPSKWCSGDYLPVSRETKIFEEFVETCPHSMDVVDCAEVFIRHWEHEKAAAGETWSRKRPIPLLLRALYRSFHRDLLNAFYSKLIWSLGIIFAIWLFIFKILDFIEARSKGHVYYMENYELWLCGVFFLSLMVLAVSNRQMGAYSSILGSKVKAALTTAIYKKMIVWDVYGSKVDVVALIGRDVEKVAAACLSLQHLWSGMFETFLVFVLVLSLTGAAVLPGVALICIFLPLQYFLGIVVASKKTNLASLSNKRISWMGDIIRGIKLIKLYGWEALLHKELSIIRKGEGDLLYQINWIKATILGMMVSLPSLLCIVVFGVQGTTGTIQSAMVFTVISFFNTLRLSLSKIPKSFQDVLDGAACLERIQTFLLEPELHPDLLTAAKDPVETVQPSCHKGIVLRNCSLSYGNGAKIILDSINLNIPQRSLLMVTGPVASGKSNLLKAILGDLTVCEGTCLVSSSKAYVPQTPWTARGTVRDNIVFGKPFDEGFYRKVLHACALEDDLKIMANGDQTWIGECGSNLSLGQKQRISLARAAYSRAEIYILDSPLSAVDLRTSRHIFKYCIQELMISAGGGIVVLATQQTELLSMSDHLVVMKDGKMANSDKYASSSVQHLSPMLSDDTDFVEYVLPDINMSTAVSNSRKPASDSTESSRKVVKSALAPEANGCVYEWYINEVGIILFVVSTYFLIISQINRACADNWISWWTTSNYKASIVFYAGIYALLASGFLLLSIIHASLYYSAGKLGASRIHDASVVAILKAPLDFFHYTPMGKLALFFSKGVETIDDALVDNTLLLQIYFWILILEMALVAYNLPLFLPVACGLSIWYLYIVRLFVRSSMPLRKVTKESVSQVVSHTQETMNGLAVVRAFRVQNQFLSDNVKLQARSIAANFSLENLALRLALEVDLVGSLLVFACCLLAVLNKSMKAADASLLVRSSFQIFLFFSIMSRTLVEVYDNMNAVEDARSLTSVQSEHEPAEEIELLGKLPSQGEISFDGVVMQYLPDMPPALNGISFTVHHGERIGIVGRTGSGKSSLVAALCRWGKILEGKVHVDTIDCSTVSLNKLRSSIAIVPEEPIMFGGSLRTNVDPFNQHQDQELVDVLHKCLLGPFLESCPDGLYTRMDSVRPSCSVGTQQLICLARVMLKPRRILLLDEATASLDSAMNVAIRQVLKAHFQDCAIFTIAHCLDTVIDSDRILVMNDGLVAEYDRPHLLLENPTSIFHNLCKSTGKSRFELLVERARANFLAAR